MQTTNRKDRIKVPAKTLSFWHLQYKQGDKGRLAIFLSRSRPTIANAFDGRASEELINAITHWYNQRIDEEIKELKKTKRRSPSKSPQRGGLYLVERRIENSIS